MVDLLDQRRMQIAEIPWKLVIEYLLFSCMVISEATHPPFHHQINKLGGFALPDNVFISSKKLFMIYCVLKNFNFLRSMLLKIL